MKVGQIIMMHRILYVH